MDDYIKLTRETIKYFFENKETMPVPDWVPDRWEKEKRGVFVSLKKEGNLRGCIGTIFPAQKNLAREVITNALSAAFKDPRFPPLKEKELGKTTVSVDILSKPEKVESLKELDCKKYGVIVKTKDGRSGVLLPNLPNVDSVKEQFSIVLKKAGIGKNEEKDIKRFIVERHKEEKNKEQN